MQSREIQQVNVWLDEASAEDATFLHALEWAIGLNLPLRVMARTTSAAVSSPRATVSEQVKSWGEACVQKGVALDTHLVAEWSKAALEQFLKPGGLCVFTAPITSEIQRDLFDKSSRHAEICQLMSPSTVATIRRILVLCDQTEIGPNYLASAARICEALETTPIVLVAAHTEREAQLKRAFVEGVCSSLHLEADFDSAVHSDVAQAVGRVVSWRSCTHVILERHNDGAWWQRVRAEVVDKQHALSSPIGVLALPEAIALEVPHKMRSSRTILPWTHRARNEACSRAGATK